MQRAINPPSHSSAMIKSFGSVSCVRHLLAYPPLSLAVALSGGPDSMALLHLLAQLKLKTEIHALTVDHGLRENSALEAKQVGVWTKAYPEIKHHILKWTGAKPNHAIMERSREARYVLLEGWCKKHGVKDLWLGHNKTDQAETFLFRLAKGSGLDGLCGMKETQFYQETELALVRPLLDISKTDLQQFCADLCIPHVEDPTNSNSKYARSRLRRARPILEEEGLSENRITATMRRMANARDALNYYTEQAMSESADIGRHASAIKLATLLSVPLEIRLRIVRQVLAQMDGISYGPRLESLETHLDHFFAETGSRSGKRFTLGGFLFAQDRKKGVFTIIRES